MGCVYALPAQVPSALPVPAPSAPPLGTSEKSAADAGCGAGSSSGSGSGARATACLAPETVRVAAPPPPSTQDKWEFMEIVVTMRTPVEQPFDTGRALASWFVEHAARVNTVAGTCAAVWHTRGSDTIVVVARFVFQDWEGQPHSVAAVAKRLQSAPFPAHAPLPLAVVVSGAPEEQHKAGVAHAKAQVDADLAGLADYGWVQRPIAARNCLIGQYCKDVLSAAFVVRIATLDEPCAVLAQHAQRWVETAFEGHTTEQKRQGTWSFGWLLREPSPRFVTVVAYFIANVPLVEFPSAPYFVQGAAALLSSESLAVKLRDVAFPSAALASVIMAGVSPVSEAYADHLLELVDLQQNEN